MARDEERQTRSQEEPIVGGLPDVPGILTALRLTPELGIHLRGLADDVRPTEHVGVVFARVVAARHAVAIDDRAGFRPDARVLETESQSGRC